MSDDSFYDISKADVIYSSNNPLVASIDNEGLVTANRTGITTITASVTIDGKTKSDSYPVKVLPNLNPASIVVDKKAVKSFIPETMQYSYLMKKSSPSAPEVAATPADPKVVAEAVQATGIPGTAIISLVDYITYDKKDYLVNFGIESVNDEFEGNKLGDQWSWIRENPAALEPFKESGFYGHCERGR